MQLFTDPLLVLHNISLLFSFSFYVFNIKVVLTGSTRLLVTICSKAAHLILLSPAFIIQMSSPYQHELSFLAHPLDITTKYVHLAI